MADFHTTDTALAAYLSIKGHPFTSTPNHGQFTFIFRDTPKLRTLVHSFEAGYAEGNVAMFYREYKRLLKMVKNGD